MKRILLWMAIGCLAMVLAEGLTVGLTFLLISL